MIRWIIIGIILLNGLRVRAQLISLTNSSSYIGQSVMVYGKVTETAFDETRKRDTCTLTILDEASGQLLQVKILPEARAGFGYRPEQVLLNKLAYFSGTLQITRGVTEMYISSPFSISFKKGEAIYAPVEEPLPPQPKARASVTKSETSTTTSARPILKTVKTATLKERKKKPKPADAVIENKASHADEINVVVAKQVPAKQTESADQTTVSKIQTSATKKEETLINIEASHEKNTAASKPNGTKPNPNPLSLPPVAPTENMVGVEMILKSKINLRAGPGGFFTTTESLTKGEIIKIVSCSYDWCKVIQVNDKILRLKQGYVKASKLKE